MKTDIGMKGGETELEWSEKGGTGLWDHASQDQAAGSKPVGLFLSSDSRGWGTNLLWGEPGLGWWSWAAPESRPNRLEGAAGL